MTYFLFPYWNWHLNTQSVITNKKNPSSSTTYRCGCVLCVCSTKWFWSNMTDLNLMKTEEEVSNIHPKFSLVRFCEFEFSFFFFTYQIPMRWAIWNITCFYPADRYSNKNSYLSLQSPFHSAKLFHGFMHLTKVIVAFSKFNSVICVIEYAWPR